LYRIAQILPVAASDVHKEGPQGGPIFDGLADTLFVFPRDVHAGGTALGCTEGKVEVGPVALGRVRMAGTAFGAAGASGFGEPALDGRFAEFEESSFGSV
jgi:hypothetical protein